MALGFATIASSLAALAAEAYKAGGRPDVLVPAHSISALAGTAAMVALLPFGLVGVCAGVAIGATAGCLYQYARLRPVFDIGRRMMASQVWPAALAAAAMVAVMLPVDRLLLEPSSHATLPGLVLLGAEVAGALAIYAGILATVAPTTYRETVDALARARKRRGGAG